MFVRGCADPAGLNGHRLVRECNREYWMRWWRRGQVRKVLEHCGPLTAAQPIAPARSPPVDANAQQLIAPEAVEAIPELEFDQMANLTAEAGPDRLVADAGAGEDA